MNQHLTEFRRLSEEVGIELPSALQAMIESGRTRYGEDWRQNWRERCLHEPPALISCFDFEWIDVAAAREEVHSWLNPGLQEGRRFLPFAQTGAGDFYCLVHQETDQPGVALLWHDRDYASVDYRDFNGFLCAQFLQAFADLSHLVDDGYPDSEALRVLELDVRLTAVHLASQERALLLDHLKSCPTHRLIQEGPSLAKRRVLHLISERECEAGIRPFLLCSSGRFSVAFPYELPSSTSSPLTPGKPQVPVWTELALDPARKMSAIRACQAQTGLDLSGAKREVDRVIAAAAQVGIGEN
jgi:hypothetical protein